MRFRILFNIGLFEPVCRRLSSWSLHTLSSSSSSPSFFLIHLLSSSFTSTTNLSSSSILVLLVFLNHYQAFLDNSKHLPSSSITTTTNPSSYSSSSSCRSQAQFPARPQGHSDANRQEGIIRMPGERGAQPSVNLEEAARSLTWWTNGIPGRPYTQVR